MVQVRIFDEMGKAIPNFNNNELKNGKLDVSTLASGLYFVQLVNVNSSEVLKLIVK